MLVICDHNIISRLFPVFHRCVKKVVEPGKTIFIIMCDVRWHHRHRKHFNVGRTIDIICLWMEPIGHKLRCKINVQQFSTHSKLTPYSLLIIAIADFNIVDCRTQTLGISSIDSGQQAIMACHTYVI